jgi:hypothetical protein
MRPLYRPSYQAVSAAMPVPLFADGAVNGVAKQLLPGQGVGLEQDRLPLFSEVLAPRAGTTPPSSTALAVAAAVPFPGRPSASPRWPRP